MAPTVVKYGTKETIQFSSKVTHTHAHTEDYPIVISMLRLLSPIFIFLFFNVKFTTNPSCYTAEWK